MAEFFRAWVLSLSGIIVFGSLCEMILPSGAYKKYIRLTICIMLVLSVLSPFADKQKEGIELEIPEGEGHTDAESASLRHTDEVMKIYKQKLCDGIEEELGQEVYIECEVCENEEAFGRIESVTIQANRQISEEKIESICEKYGISKNEVSIRYTK